MPDQMFIATPAITGGEIFLRSKTTLFCIGKRSWPLAACRSPAVTDASPRRR